MEVTGIITRSWETFPPWVLSMLGMNFSTDNSGITRLDSAQIVSTAVLVFQYLALKGASFKLLAEVSICPHHCNAELRTGCISWTKMDWKVDVL